MLYITYLNVSWFFAVALLEGPPPPPPMQNGYAFNTPQINQELRNPLKSQSQATKTKNKPKEPIYESIKPRPEPLGGPGGPINGGNEMVDEEYGFGCQVNQFANKNKPTPLKALPNIPNGTNIPNGVGGEHQADLTYHWPHIPLISIISLTSN